MLVDVMAVRAVAGGSALRRWLEVVVGYAKVLARSGVRVRERGGRGWIGEGWGRAFFPDRPEVSLALFGRIAV